MTRQHNKFSPEYNTELKRLSLILDNQETDDTKKKSKQLEKLLTERETIDKEKQPKIPKSKKPLLNANNSSISLLMCEK